MNKVRIEHDSIGTKEISLDSYYGIHSVRAAENFPITKQAIHPQLINSLAAIKQAAAITNYEAGLLEGTVKEAIVQASQDILDGLFHDQFIVDPIQGGAGTSMNMNANEVICNRALELLGNKKGEYRILHPNDHINAGQSTNDVIPTAGKIAIIQLMQQLKQTMHTLILALEDKATEFYPILKMGRTQLQDAVPIRLGQEFHAYVIAVERCNNRLDSILQELYTVNLGGTAIGTGLNADLYYFHHIVPNLSRITHLPLQQAEDLVDGTQHVDVFVMASNVVKTCAVTLSKIASDLRLLSSGPKTGFGEITLPAKQNGSSIMPGKINPVVPEVINQIAFNIIGNDVTIGLAAEAGQLELNAFEPIIFYKLIESIETLTNGIKTFTDNCICGITANAKRCNQLVTSSVGIVTALCPYIGYGQAASLVKEAMTSGKTIEELVLHHQLISQEELATILNPTHMTQPGISGKVYQSNLS
ncbi:aspartate ammonia-lyase [Streptococcus respiraculi]|uniref:aspartate ammonia-lyase n=1 Tax=Streptococcus respiraculi TaxID=2021971 RepID=UPI000E759D2A|nr:aspartate ammonia-lyase [Streptococcus respiraculi]